MSDSGYEIICQNCRSPVPSAAPSCLHCGHPLTGPPPRPKEEPASFFGHSLSEPGAVASAVGTLRASELALPSLSERSFRNGGFWIRVLAAFLDGLFLWIASYVLARYVGLWAGPLLGFIGQWLYFAGMESSGNQATFGKMVCGLMVTDTEGRRISFGRATGRYFAKILSALILGIGYLMVGWTKQKRGLHDFIAGTLVIRR